MGTERIRPGGPFLRAQPFADTPVGPEEASDSWWAGQMMDVPRAIAATAALAVTVAISGGYNYGEEVASWVPSETSSTLAGTQRAQITPSFKRWEFSEELPVTSAITLEEEYSLPQQLQPLPVQSICFAYEEELPRLLLDEEYWRYLAVFSATLQGPVPQSNDEFAPVISDEDAGFSYAALISKLSFSVWSLDEDLPVTPTTPTLEEEYWFQYASLGSKVTSLPWVGDEDLSSTIALEDEYWFQGERYTSIFSPLALVDEEIVPQPTPLFVVEEYLWPDQRLVPILLYKPVPWLYIDDSDLYPTPFVPAPFDATIKFDITTGMLVKPLSKKIVMLI